MAYVRKMSCKSEEIVNFRRKSRRKDKNEIQCMHGGTSMQNLYDKIILGIITFLEGKELHRKVATSPGRN
jgi:hypothetical protein